MVQGVCRGRCSSAGRLGGCRPAEFQSPPRPARPAPTPRPARPTPSCLPDPHWAPSQSPQVPVRASGAPTAPLALFWTAWGSGVATQPQLLLPEEPDVPKLGL